MALKEHENNIITKEYDDPITNYLRNIIQRYFQIENEISQESKEAIIIQAYTRLKEILNAYTTKYIICINERSGNIDLFIKDFGGEAAFDKNTAFNKDFCDVTVDTKTLWDGTDEDYYNFGKEQEDHIVAGDDDRLSDARVPLMHVHTIDDVIGLREKLEEYNLINGGFHLHTNQNVLNMLIYTGTRTSIDLLLIEDLVAKVEKAVERFKDTDVYFTTIGQHYINQLQDIFTPIYNKLKYIDENINSWINNWLPKSKAYTDLQNVSFKKYINNLIKGYLSNNEYALLKETMEKSIRVIYAGSANLANIPFKYDTLKTVNTRNEIAYYNETEFRIKHGYTNVALSCSHSSSVPYNVTANFINNDLNNGSVNVFLEYDKDGVHYKDQLPCTYQVKDSRHDFIHVYYNTDSGNNINVYFKRLSYLPVYLYRPITLYSWVEDYSNKTNQSFLQIDEHDTADINNNQPQQNIISIDDASTTAHFIIKMKLIPSVTKRIQDLETVTAAYGAGGLGNGDYGAYKELLIFTTRENYNGPFTLTMNTGHWYGFAIWESTDGINFTHMVDNYASGNATHNMSPLTLSISNVTFVANRSYKIITEECDGGGSEAENFQYSFMTATNFAVSIATDSDVPVDIQFNAHKNGDAGELSWIVTKHLEGLGQLIGPDYQFKFELIKNNNIAIDCGNNTSYNDTPLDTLPPNPPRIVGKCVSVSGNTETYEFLITASDQRESVSYALKIYANDSDELNTGLLCETNNISISSFSDIKTIHFNTNATLTDFSDNSVYQLVDAQDINQHVKKVTINKQKDTSYFDDKLIFCDNTFHNIREEIVEYIKPFNIKLAKTNNNIIKSYIQNNLLFEDDDLFWSFLPEPYYYVEDGYITPSDIITNAILEYDTNYIGQFDYGSLNDFFNNAKISYQVLIVPGKGEDDA